MQVEHPSSGTAGRAEVVHLDNGIALVTLGDSAERIVTLTMARMESLREICLRLKEKPPRAVIITGPSAEMFTAGADINAIRDVRDAARGEELARVGQSIFALVEALPCPSLAAISGPCVGGGCELALACTYRVITDHRTSVIGLPEVKLGILPGFGGTQRLPRLVGLPKALDIILGGKTLRPKQALACGLVNEVVPVEELRERCEQILLGTKRARAFTIKLKDRFLTDWSIGRRIVKNQALRSVHKETKGFYPAPIGALNSVFLGLEQGKAIGYQFEAKELGRLIVTPQSKALVRIFFLTEAAKNLGKSARKAVEHVHAVVVGAGVMGAGIAGALARHDCQVILKDSSDEALSRGVEQIRGHVQRLSYLSEKERSFILNRVEATTKDSANLGNATIAIEAIFEEISVKKRVLGDLAKLLPQDAIIASNTSSLPISKIAAALDHPERVIGMHFFNPVEKMPLIEIVRGRTTGNRALAVVAALATKLGKYPIVVEDVPGFLVNRILAPYIAEAGLLLDDGYSIKDIDRAAVEFGLPMGPLRLLDEVGLDVADHVAEVMEKGYGDRMKSPDFLKKLLAVGRKGKKSGGGFYDFQGGEAHPLANHRALLGIAKAEVRQVNRQEITDRLIYRLISEAVRCLDEGVAGVPGREAADQLDLGTVMGLGFPPFRGGVLFYADSLGAPAVQQRLKELAERFGNRFAPPDGVSMRAQRGKSFLDTSR